MNFNKFVFIFFTVFSFFSYAGGDLPFPLDQIELMSTPEVWVAEQNAPKEWKDLRFLVYHFDGFKSDKVVLRIQNHERMTLDQRVVDVQNLYLNFIFNWPEANFAVCYDGIRHESKVKLESGASFLLFRESVLLK